MLILTYVYVEYFYSFTSFSNIKIVEELFILNSKHMNRYIVIFLKQKLRSIDMDKICKKSLTIIISHFPS